METEDAPMGLAGQLKAMAGTVLSGIQNRGELFLLELEEEKTNFIELLVWTLIAGVLGLMFLGVFTVLMVMLCPEGAQVYAMAGFCVLYLTGMIVALLNLRSLMKKMPPSFSGTINEIKKDRECFDSLK
jgi:uncharacterized membrane protein YqjE